MAAAAAVATTTGIQGVPAPVVAAPSTAPTPAVVAPPGPQAYPVAQNYYQAVSASPAPSTTPNAVLGAPPLPGKIMAQPQLYNQPPPPPPHKGGYNQSNDNQGMWSSGPGMQQPPPNRYGGQMNQMNYNSGGADNQGYPNLQQPPPSLQRQHTQQQQQNNMDNQWGNNNQRGGGGSFRSSRPFSGVILT